MFAVRITASAEQDLLDGYAFYDAQESGLGQCFPDSLIADIDSLALYAGPHSRPLAQRFRALAKRFPFAIHHDFDGQVCLVLAVLDYRRNPKSIRAALIARRPPS